MHSNTAITPFLFEENAVRVIHGDNGEIWFVATDVCHVLHYANPSRDITRHTDEDDRSTVLVERGGSVTIINESGLYSLILRSRKPEAKKFKKWVTSEVLPSIRKHGTYSVPTHQPKKSEKRYRYIMSYMESFWIITSAMIAECLQAEHDEIMEFAHSVGRDIPNMNEHVFKADISMPDGIRRPMFVMTQTGFAMLMARLMGALNNKEREVAQSYMEAVLAEFAEANLPNYSIPTPSPSKYPPRIKRNCLEFNELMAVRGLIRFNAYMEGIGEKEMEAELCAYLSVPTIADIGKESLNNVMDYLWKAIHAVGRPENDEEICTFEEMLPLRGLLDFFVFYGAEGTISYKQLTKSLADDYGIDNIKRIRRKDLLKAMFLVWGKLNSYCFSNRSLSTHSPAIESVEHRG